MTTTAPVCTFRLEDAPPGTRCGKPAAYRVVRACEHDDDGSGMHCLEHGALMRRRLPEGVGCSKCGVNVVGIESVAA